MSRDALIQAIHEASFTRAGLGAELVSYLRPVIAVAEAPEVPGLGQSKLGGSPDLPDGFEWPEAMAFLAQINLAEVHPHDTEQLVPADGMLYLFASTSESELSDPTDGARVFYAPAGAWTRTTAPDSVDTDEGLLEERGIQFGPSFKLYSVQDGDAGAYLYRPRFDRDDEDTFRSLLTRTGYAVPEFGTVAGAAAIYNRDLRAAFQLDRDVELLDLQCGALRRIDDTSSVYRGNIHVLATRDDAKQGTFWALLDR